MHDFQSIMASHGFTVDRYDFESTIIGFDYDIYFSLFSDLTPFDVDRSRIYRQFDTPHAFLRVNLVRARYSIDRAVRFFQQRWRDDLRYLNPVCEIIETYQSENSARIHVLTISEKNAVTILFDIT